jgi:hypothetical protein
MALDSDEQREQSAAEPSEVWERRLALTMAFARIFN